MTHKSLFDQRVLVGAMVLCCSVVACKSTQRLSQLSVSQALVQAPQPQAVKFQPGRYLGFLRLSAGDFKVPMTVDIVIAKGRSEQSNLKAVFRYDLGRFQSDESHTEYYEEMLFNHKTGEVFVSQQSGQYQLAKLVAPANAAVTGTLINTKAEVVGDFTLVPQRTSNGASLAETLAKIFPDRKVIPSLSGSYAGTCQGKPAVFNMSLISWPNTAANWTSQNFFEGYRANAELGLHDKMLCRNSEFCTKGLYNDISFSLESLQLNAKGKTKERSCKLSSTGLSCEKCNFAATTNADSAYVDSVAQLSKPNLRKFSLNFSKGNPVGKSPDYPGAVEGEYFGYLYNEVSGRYQFLRLKVNAQFEKIEGMTKPGLMMSGISTLFFGESQSNEFMVYRYKPGFFADSSPFYVFDGPGESLLQISVWNEGAVKGIWYGKTHGRVGTVELVRGRLPKLPQQFPTVNTISGTYTADSMRLNLLAQSNLSISSRDFYALSTKGIVAPKSNPEKRTLVNSASFNLYTDKVALELVDGRIITGEFAPEGLRLNWHDERRYGSAPVVTKTELYTYEKDPFNGTTAMQMYQLMRRNVQH